MREKKEMSDKGMKNMTKQARKKLKFSVGAEEHESATSAFRKVSSSAAKHPTGAGFHSTKLKSV